MAGWRDVKTQAVIATVAVAALAVAANYLGAKYHTQFDLTRARLYSLALPTEEALDGLDATVTLTPLLFPAAGIGDDALEQIRNTLDAFRSSGGEKIAVERLDATTDPVRARSIAQELGFGELRDPLVVVSSGGRRKEVRVDEMVELDYTGGGLGGPPPVKTLRAEEALVSAILAVTRDEKPAILFAEGHGERDHRGSGPTDLGDLTTALERNDFEVAAWDALFADEVPPDTDVVVVAGPGQPWQRGESDALGQFLAAGGRAILLLDPILQRDMGGAYVPSGLSRLLEDWGVEVLDDSVIETRRPLRSYQEFFAFPVVGHPSTDALGGIKVVSLLARSVVRSDAPPANLTHTSLLETSDESWGETDLSGLLDGSAEYEEDDLAGPRSVLMAVERTDGGPNAPRGILIVAGDADLFANDYMIEPGNRGLALNLFAHLVEEPMALAIPPKERDVSRLYISRDEALWVSVLVMLLIPAATVAAGLALWLRRRRA